MELIYINQLGPDFKHQYQYEFIFSNYDEIDIDEWFVTPASVVNENLCPPVGYINLIGLVKDTDMKLELIQNSDYFGMIDAVDGIVALGWEKIDDDYKERLYFKFGETLENVTKKINSKGYQIIKQENKFKDK
jgi:hypothetical protein